MLTISKPLSAGQALTYHREEFQNARENYYTEGEAIKGEWHGKLAAQWGLVGEVEELHFDRLSQGQHPLTAEQLVRHQTPREYTNENGDKVHSMEHRAGWDATFSAPKTVSLTALVGGDDGVRKAHRESVQVALNEMEKYVQARIGGNHPAETTGKWIAAKFEHDSARPVNGYAAPQLHTHVVFFNLTERSNGEIRSIQPHELYRSQQYATAIYRSELSLRLSALGYEVEQGQHGEPEIRGYTPEYLQASSPRSRQIREHMEEVGVHGAGAAQIAAHQTREAKQDISHAEMQMRHQEMAAKFGNQPQRVVEEANARQSVEEARNPEQKQKDLDEALTYARERNLERQAVADERELVRDALNRTMGSASLTEVQTEFARQVQAGKFVEVDQQTSGWGRAYTTPEMIGLERDNINLMRAGQGQHQELVTFATRHYIESESAHLSVEQRAAVDQVLSNRDQLFALEGAAGAGKTTSLTVIREAAESEGYTVHGFAPTSRATHKLEEAGVKSSTLQYHLAHPEEFHSEAKHLYIVDEASLASTRQVNDFLHRLEAQDRVLFVGDTRQHEAVEAGRPYHQLQETGMQTARLDAIVRQQDPALKEVVEQLARGDVHEAIRNLDGQGRVHEIENRQERLAAMVQDYVTHPETTLIVSPDNQTRHELNTLIHSEMQRLGHISSSEHQFSVLQARQELTGADRQWASQYQVGDVVRYARGSTQLGIEPGEYARVAGIDHARNLIAIERENGETQTYDPRRLQGVTVYTEGQRSISEGDRVQFTAPSRDLHIANRDLGSVERVDGNGDMKVRADSGRTVEFNIREHPHLDYGYAVTSHSSQGQTADRVLIHVDSGRGEQLLNSRMAYVSVSRGRFDAQIYTNDKNEIAHDLSRETSKRTAIQQEHEPAQSSHKVGQHAIEQSQGHGQSIGT